MRRFGWVGKKIVHVIPVFLFFLVCFTLINWIESYLFEESGLTKFRFAEIAIAALLIAKIVLIADHLPGIQLFREKPLICGIIWKTMIYWVLLLGVRWGIAFIPFYYESGYQLVVAYKTFQGTMHWKIFVSVQAYYLMLLFIFVTFQELAFKIGPLKIRQIFFGF